MCELHLEGNPNMSWLLAALLATAMGAPAPDCMIVEFTVDNCGPCRQLQPALEKLKGEGWDIRTVNAEREPLLVRKHAIESLPTLVLISNGKEVDRIVGAAPYEIILPRLAKLLLVSQATATSNSNPQPAAPQAGPSPAAHLGRSSTTTESEKLPSPLSTQIAAPESVITVRGQSPNGQFPMLAAVAGSALANASSSQLIAEKFEKLGSTSNQLASNPTSVTPAAFAAMPGSLRMNAAASPMPSSLPSRQPDRTPAQPSRQLPLTKNAAPIDLQQAIARAAAATVRIRVDEENTTAYGTGTVIDVHGDEALVLTCGHLFREMKPHSQLTIDLFAGRSQPLNIPAQLIDFKANAGDEDIGLISFRLPFAIEPVPILPQAESLTVRQPAFSFGCDHGENPTRRDTQLKSINRYLGAPNVEIAGAPAVGRSGGGLFDHHGRLIGVCNAADAAGDEGIYAAAGIVYSQIERLGLTHLFNENPPTQSAPIQLASSPTTSNPVAPAAGQSLLPFSSTPGKLASGRSQVSVAPAVATASPQLTCIVRDTNGQERVVTVDTPSSDLLDAIHRQARQ